MLAAQLLFQMLDALLFHALLAAGVASKCRCSVFKELLLSCVKDLRLKLVLVTKSGDRYPFDQVTLEDENLLLWGVVMTFLSHGLPSVRDCLAQTG
jgi:hypothetical protein